MGYFTRPIATETISPASVSLAENPNYIAFEGQKQEVNVEEDMWYGNEPHFQLRISSPGILRIGAQTFINISYFEIKDEKSGEIIRFCGDSPSAPARSADYIFTATDSTTLGSISTVAGSVLEVLKKCPYISTNFDISANIGVYSGVITLIPKDKRRRFQLQNHNTNFISMSETASDSILYYYSIADSNNIDIDISINDLDTVNAAYLMFNINDVEYNFSGTVDKSKLDNANFMYNKNDKAVTAENLKDCMLKNSFFGINFEITVPPVIEQGMPKSGSVIRLRTKNNFNLYTMSIVNEGFVTITSRTGKKQISDLLAAGDTEVQLDIYNNTGVFLGEHRVPKHIDKQGTYLTTLSKAYMNDPVWFDINSVAGNTKAFSSAIISQSGWNDPGTLTDYRVIGKRFDGANTETFYISDVLYSIRGSNRPLEKNILDDYVFDIKYQRPVKPLSRQPELTHTKGQVQYFNFLFSDHQHSVADLGNDEYDLGIKYRLLTQSGRPIADLDMHEQNRRLFGIANTIRLDIDSLLEQHANTGRVEVYLCCKGKIASYPLKFRILPGHLYPAYDFAFLNSMGGWSSFNFPGKRQTEFKTKANTYYKTQTPGSGIHSQLETVYDKEREEGFTCQTMPVDATVADWLKELSASPVVYELSSGRYVIIDDLTVKHNTTDDLFTMQMKFHYSDSPTE